MELQELFCRKKLSTFICLLFMAIASFSAFFFSPWRPVHILQSFKLMHVPNDTSIFSDQDINNTRIGALTGNAEQNLPYTGAGVTMDLVSWTSTKSSLEVIITAEVVNSSPCSSLPLNLTGPILMDSTPVSSEELLIKYPYIKRGGRLHPQNCVPDQRVAIIIPYRNRRRHLHTLLNNLIPMLHRQLVDVVFFLIEQAGPATFNRGALFNIGFLESQKVGSFDCFIFHDVDMVPTNDEALYRCGDNPRHFIAGMNSLSLPYEDYFGGVVGMSRDQYIRINGHSNMYFGWGGEDDDLLIRCRAKGYKFIRYPVTIGRYVSLFHKRDKGNEPNPDRFRLLQSARRRQGVDGLNTVTYTLEKMDHGPLYTRVYVSVDIQTILQTAPDYLKRDMVYLYRHIW